jgi:phosphate transport system substrate-binding protein
MKKSTSAALRLAGVLLVGGAAFAQAVQVDAKLPEYKAVQGVSGAIKSIGSDTMNNLQALWSEGFRKFYPNVTVEIEGKGSSTAPPALIAGTANFAPMSRAMKASEIDEFEREFGHKPTNLPSGIDMLAVYVHKDNPLAGLTMPQIDAIFSSSRKGGLTEDIRTWGQLGLTGDWAKQPISLYGRNSASGTYGYFQEHALFKGDYKADVKEQPGSSSVVQSVANDRYAIGYSGIGYKTADVRALPLSPDAGKPAIEATPENAYTGAYPLSRFLYLYINYEPNSELDPLRREYVRYIFSKQGQEDVVKAGYYPVTAAIAEKARDSVGIDIGTSEAGAAR